MTEPQHQQDHGSSPYRDADGRPRYGMLLPEGRDISEFIVPGRTPARERSGARSGSATGADRAAGPSAATGPPAAGGAFPGPPADRRTPPQVRQPGPRSAPPAGPPIDPRDHPAERHRLRRRRRAIATLVAGLLLIALGPVTGAAVGVLGSVDGVGSVLGSGIRTTDGGAATLPADAERLVYRTDGEPLAQCAITDPSGAELPTTVVAASGAGDAQLTVPGVRFTTADAGRHEIDCADVPAGTDLLVSPPLTVRSPGTALGWVVAGLAAGAVGLGLAIWGVLVLRATRTPAWRR